MRKGTGATATARMAANHVKLLLLVLSLSVYSVKAQDGEDIGQYFLERPGVEKHAVIMTGPGVGDLTKVRFRRWSFSLHDILIRDYGYSSDSVTLIFDRNEQPEAPGDERIDFPADREGIEAGLAEVAARVSPGDQLILYMIGHGSGAEDEAKFNIRGPDITGGEFAELLKQFDEQDVAIINTTSASYSFAAALSAPGRVIISATRSPSERYDTWFSEFFIAALDSRNGDRDKNLRVSMLEAFTYAKSSVEQWYEDQGRLAAEHAGLDDNGDALFALNPGISEIDGRLAEIAFIDNLVAEDDSLSAEARQIKGRMQELEREIFLLRGRKADYLEDDYWQQLQDLLVDLARNTGRFDELR